MSIASESKHCPKCGAPIVAEAPQGLCPKCLLAAVSVPTEGGGQGPERGAAPPVEAVAAAFPHLEILELIGQGGMGFVFKARQPKLDRFVALKILPPSLATDPAFAERFTREGRMLARLNHPNIVTVHDFGQANGLFYLLMEFVDGVNLRQAMKAGRFTPAQALAIVPKICEALQYAHNEGILHRDIKPENILLDSKGRVKIADFGIAKLISDAHAETALTVGGATLGTPHYMAPEQIETPGEVDHRADIYSLGVVFYELLTGELPLGRFAPPSQRVSVDARVDEIVLRALRKERELRQQSATEVKTQVETVAGSALPAETAVVSARTKPHGSILAWRKLSHAASKNKALSVVLLAVIVVGSSILIWNLMRPPPLPAVAFNGSSRVEIPSSKDLEFGRRPFSVSLWLRTTTRRKNITIMNKRRNAKTDYGWGIHGQEDNQFVFYAAGCSHIISSPQDYRDGRWHHLTVVRHDARVDIYYDAQLVGSGPESCNFQDNHPIYIAMDGLGGDHYQGELAEVCIYNRPLNEDEIADEWNNGQRRKTWVAGPGLVAGYRFDEGTGPVARDFSGAGHDGVFVNHPIRSAKTRDRAPHGQQQIASPQSQTASSQLVIDAVPFSDAHHEPGELNWGFKCFIPPDHLASILFVHWTNGVPTPDSGFSMYFKVGKAGGIDLPFCSLSCYRVAESSEFSKLTDIQRREVLTGWKFPESAGLTNAVRWDVNLGAGFTVSAWRAMPPYSRSRIEFKLPQSVRTGYQRVIPLVEFDRPEGDGNHRHSGVELRIFLEPLRSPAIRTRPNETDRTNYVAGSGFAGTWEDTLNAIKNLPIEP